MKRTTKTAFGAYLSIFLSLLLAAFTLTGPLPAAAQEAPERVGRIAYLSGDVQFYADGDDDWAPARVNYPVTSRNSVSTGADGRAEIRIGSTALALDADAQLDIRVLDDAGFDAEMVQGTMSLRIRNFQDGDSYRIATPAGWVTLESAGRYRFDAQPGRTDVTVFSGRALVDAAGRVVEVDAGRSVRIVDRGGRPVITFAAATSTGFDEWALVRDERYRERQATRYVSPEMTGYEELDDYGRWATDDAYGAVWYPTTVAVDWAPYRYGNWRWVAPWGWTWVDYSPWGFAPFHYGRWVMISGRWGWCPGGYVVRPAYAPALVGFVGGSHWSVAFSFGSGPAVGWYPLSPWERYAPHYRHRATYINKVNNITIVNAHRHDRRDRDEVNRINRTRGATVVPRDAFERSRPAWREAVRVPERELERQRLVRADELPRGPIRRDRDGARNERDGGRVGASAGDRSGADDRHDNRDNGRLNRDQRDAQPSQTPRRAEPSYENRRVERPDARQGERRDERQSERQSERQTERQTDRQLERERSPAVPQFERRIVDPPSPRLERQAPTQPPRAAPPRPDRSRDEASSSTRSPDFPSARQRPEVRDATPSFSDRAPRIERSRQSERPRRVEPEPRAERFLDRAQPSVRSVRPERVERAAPTPRTDERMQRMERSRAERAQTIERSRNVEAQRNFERPQRAERQQQFQRSQRVERQAERQVERSQPRASSSEKARGGERFGFDGGRNMR